MASVSQVVFSKMAEGRLGRAVGVVKGQESWADKWSSTSVPGMGCLLKADAVMPCL